LATELQKSVWSKLKEIPKGRVTSYKELANALNSKGIRAVASAVGKNPYAPNVPCHRVVRSNGEIGNYTHPQGVMRKIALLKEEGVEVGSDGIIVEFEKKLFTF